MRFSQKNALVTLFDAYLTIGVVFFGVLWSLLGVRDLDTGVVLGATFTLRGVLDSFDDSDAGIGFGIADLNKIANREH